MARANVFDDDDSDDVLDLSAIATMAERPPLDRDDVARAASSSGFLDRAPARAAEKVESPTGQRRHRTGRNIQLNLKMTLETFELFDKMSADEPRVVTFEQAVASLARERGLVD